MLSREAIRAALASTHPDRWAIRWQYAKGDGFFDALLDAIARADEDNARLLGLGFPQQVRAVTSWQHVPGYAQKVEAWAEDLAREQAGGKR